MVAHAASSVGLDHRIHACRFEHALRKVGLYLRSECLSDNQRTMLHVVIIRGTRLRAAPLSSKLSAAPYQKARVRKIAPTQGIIRRRAARNDINLQSRCPQDR